MFPNSTNQIIRYSRIQCTVPRIKHYVYIRNMLFHILPLPDCFVASLRAMTESIMLIVVIISKLNIKSKDIVLAFYIYETHNKCSALLILTKTFYSFFSPSVSDGGGCVLRPFFSLQSPLGDEQFFA